MGKYFAYAEGVISHVQAELELERRQAEAQYQRTCQRIEAQLGEMRRTLQEIARFEYRRGKQDANDAKAYKQTQDKSHSRPRKNSRRSAEVIEDNEEDENES